MDTNETDKAIVNRVAEVLTGAEAVIAIDLIREFVQAEREQAVKCLHCNSTEHATGDAVCNRFDLQGRNVKQQTEDSLKRWSVRLNELLFCVHEGEQPYTKCRQCRLMVIPPLSRKEIMSINIQRICNTVNEMPDGVALSHCLGYNKELGLIEHRVVTTTDDLKVLVAEIDRLSKTQ